MDVAWPVVKDRLIELLPALLGPNVLVLDGPAVSGEAPNLWVTVGWQPSTDDISAGSYNQSLGPDGFQLREDGLVLAEFGAVTGDPEIPSAFAMVAALQEHVRANQTLDVLSPDATVSVVVEVAQAQSAAGAAQRLLVSVTYTTRL